MQLHNEPLKTYLARVLVEFNAARNSPDFANFKTNIENAAYQALRYRCYEVFNDQLLVLDNRTEKGERKPTHVNPDGTPDFFKSVNADLLEMHRKSVAKKVQKNLERRFFARH